MALAEADGIKVIGQGGSFSTSESEGHPPGHDTIPAQEPDYPDRDALVALVGSDARLLPFSDFYIEVNGKRKFARGVLVSWLKDTFKFYTIGGCLFYYMDGNVQPNGDKFIRQITEVAFPEVSNHDKNEIVHHIRDASLIDETEIEINPYILPVDNGLLDIDTETLTPFNPEIFSWNKLPIKYDAKAECPKIEEFLVQVLPNEKDRTLFLQWCGFCLFRQYYFKRFFIAIGPPNTGKSVTLGLLEALVGAKNTVSTNLLSLEGNRFASAKLHRKMLNIQADISEAPIKRSPTLKSLTGNDLVPAEYKGGELFEFRNYAKIIFSCNSPPEFLEASDAVFSRLLFIEFSQLFEEGKNAKLNLIDELTTDAELSGFLNLCLKHLRQILENKRFSFDMTAEDVRKYYERKANNLAWFLDERCEFVAESRISKEQFFNEYSQFCFANKTPAMSLAKVGRELPRLFQVTSGRLGGSRTTCWVNISFKKEGENNEEPFKEDGKGNLVLQEVVT